MTFTVRSLVLGTSLALALPLVAAGTAEATAAAGPAGAARPAAVAHRDAPGQEPITLNGHGLYKVRLANTADGRIKVSWKWKKSRSKRLKKWKIVTSTSRKLGADQKSYKVKAKKRSAIIRHAPSVTPASGDYTFVKVYSLPKHGKKHGSSTHWIQAPVTAVPNGGSSVVIGTYNVRDADISTDTGARAWDNRKQAVFDTIKGSGAGIVNLQEASKSSDANPKYVKQAQDVADGTGLTLVNRDFFPGGNGSQGTRILYDAHLYTVASQGSEPITGNRFIEWAEFVEKTSGRRFWDISMHLAQGTAPSVETTRVQEARQVIARAQALHNSDGAEVFVAGDSNSTLYSLPKGLVHRTFIGAGFYDAFATTNIANQAYPTTSDFKLPVAPSPQRRDIILSYGGPWGSYWYKNLVDNSRIASDHFMQVAQLPLA